MKEHNMIKHSDYRSYIFVSDRNSLYCQPAVFCYDHTTVLSHLQATGDPYYLEAGRTILDNLNRFARVPCGFAAMKDVRTGSHEDR